MSMTDRGGPDELRRRLGVFDAVVIGLGSMIGAGIFAAPAPAARAAGSGLLIALAVAAAVAYCNATSSARLAARYPASGRTYVYGRERLGPFWGYLAGWGFVVGKTGPGRPAGHRHPRSHHAARHDGGLDAADVPAAGRRPGGGQRRLRHDRRPGQPRDKALRSHGLTVIELHNHLLYEQPRLYYLHFWKTGDATELAHALRAGLDQVHAPSG